MFNSDFTTDFPDFNVSGKEWWYNVDDINIIEIEFVNSNGNRKCIVQYTKWSNDILK